MGLLASSSWSSEIPASLWKSFIQWTVRPVVLMAQEATKKSREVSLMKHR